MIITCPNCSSRFRLNADLLGDAGRNVKCAKCSHGWFADPSALAEEPAPAAARPAPKAAAPAPPPPAPPPPAPPPPAPPPPAPPPPAPPPPAPPIPEKEDEQAPADDEAPPGQEEEDDSAPPPIPTEEEIAQFQARPEPKPSTLKWWGLLFVVIVLIVVGLFFYSRDIVAMYPPSNKLFTMLGMGGNVLGSGLQIPDYKIETRADGKDRLVVIKGQVKNTTEHVIDVPLLRGSVKDSKGIELYVWWFKTKEPRVLGGEAVAYETDIRNPPRGGVNVSVTFTNDAEMEMEKARVKAGREKK